VCVRLPLLAATATRSAYRPPAHARRIESSLRIAAFKLVARDLFEQGDEDRAQSREFTLSPRVVRFSEWFAAEEA
jgi:hypothetical protein